MDALKYKFQSALLAVCAATALTLIAGNANATLVALGPVTAPGSLAFSHSVVTSDGYVAPINPANYNFFDSFTFNLSPAAIVGAIATSINFSAPFAPVGITNFELRIRDVTSSTNIQAWTTVTPVITGFSIVNAVTNPILLPADTYAVEVRGLVAPNGSYSGVLNLSPSTVVSAVPLPASMPMLLSGLACFGIIMRRRMFS